MRIQSIQNHNTKYQSFTAWTRVVNNIDDMSVKHRNNTIMFRKDFEWHDFVCFINNKYKNVPKVNIYDYACSDGSEAYSLLIELMENLPEKDVKKFIPIIAKDYDSRAIYKALKHKLSFRDEEINDINCRTNNHRSKYFSFDPASNLYIAQPILTNNVNFHVSDIRFDIENIKPDNSIILARNFWPYLGDDSSRKELLQALYNRLNKNCFLVVGEYDKRAGDYVCNIDKLLKETNFKQVDSFGHVFEKEKEKEKEILKIFSFFR